MFIVFRLCRVSRYTFVSGHSFNMYILNEWSPKCLKIKKGLNLGPWPPNHGKYFIKLLSMTWFLLKKDNPKLSSKVNIFRSYHFFNGGNLNDQGLHKTNTTLSLWPPTQTNMQNKFILLRVKDSANLQI